jgi:hypothetical protein
MSNAATTTSRDQLLALITAAPDDVIARHSGIVRDALSCPAWCAQSHDPKDGDASVPLDIHTSVLVDIEALRDGAETVCLNVDPDVADGAATVMLGTTYMTADPARELARVLVEHANRIDGQQ